MFSYFMQKMCFKVCGKILCFHHPPPPLAASIENDCIKKWIILWKKEQINFCVWHFNKPTVVYIKLTMIYVVITWFMLSTHRAEISFGLTLPVLLHWNSLLIRVCVSSSSNGQNWANVVHHQQPAMIQPFCPCVRVWRRMQNVYVTLSETNHYKNV